MQFKEYRERVGRWGVVVASINNMNNKIINSSATLCKKVVKSE